jgi:hypothetical protein
VSEPERERERDRDDGIRFPDARPLRRIQLATVVLIAIAVVLTLTSGSRPAEVRWGTLIGLALLTAVVFLGTRRHRARRASHRGQNTRNNREMPASEDRKE